MFSDMLTKREIERARDVIALGPLGINLTTDLALAEAGLIDVYSRNDESKLNRLEQFRSLYEDAQERAAKGWALTGRFLVIAHPESRKRFYNEQGGVKGKWWKDSGQTFADYMRYDVGTERPVLKGNKRHEAVTDSE